jgi:D-glycero-D-manno-heptose 1,7-bisphosphate phosphatase
MDIWGNGSRTAPDNPAQYTNCVVGLDRDGTINEDLGTYVTSANKFTPIPGSLEAISILRKKLHKVVIITNQAGISKNMMSTQDVDSIHDYMFQLLGEAGCPSIDALYYSTTNLKDDIYAKPNTGMFKRCEKENPSIKFSQGFYVGDKISDLKVAAKVGARPVLVRTGYGLETEKKLNTFANRTLKKQTYIFDNLLEFAQAL